MSHCRNGVNGFLSQSIIQTSEQFNVGYGNDDGYN